MVIIILLIIAIIGLFMTVVENETISTIGICAFVGTLILIIILLSIELFIEDIDSNITEDIAYEIYSLNDNIESTGRFILGTGHIESTDYYYFYIKTDKGLKVEKINATNVYIQETNEVTPRVVYQYHKYIYPEWYKKWFILDPNPHGDVTVIIKVPINTVTTQYTLDLQ